MTATPAPAAPTPDQPTATDTDQALAQRATSHGEWLAGLIADGMLDTVGQPGKLPTLLFSDMDEEDVWRVWGLALAVGYRAGQLAGRPDFNRDTLARLQLALTQAGYTAMAGLASRTTATIIRGARRAHPADAEYHQVRGEHW